MSPTIHPALLISLPEVGTLRHEPELDEGAHAGGQDGVVDGVDVLEVVDRPPLPVLGVDAEFVLEESVEAHVLEAALAADEGEVALPVGAQPLGGATRPDGEVREAVARAFDPVVVGRDDAGRRRLRRRLGLRAEQQAGAERR